jgi:hypothetical protein
VQNEWIGDASSLLWLADNSGLKAFDVDRDVGEFGHKWTAVRGLENTRSRRVLHDRHHHFTSWRVSLRHGKFEPDFVIGCEG